MCRCSGKNTRLSGWEVDGLFIGVAKLQKRIFVLPRFWVILSLFRWPQIRFSTYFLGFEKNELSSERMSWISWGESVTYFMGSSNDTNLFYKIGHGSYTPHTLMPFRWLHPDRKAIRSNVEQQKADGAEERGSGEGRHSHEPWAGKREQWNSAGLFLFF